MAASFSCTRYGYLLIEFQYEISSFGPDFFLSGKVLHPHLFFSLKEKNLEKKKKRRRRNPEHAATRKLIKIDFFFV